ncbi:c-type cytochrome [Pontibacter litorisediminis]|uniref:c-type cytochrome n=1 Tax=Pontibacter litorisediminis TaxID=1846260 RepID=UPI0023EC4AF2|nr:diheme cytochrome c-553 [Pontibacter litorisediminis]
MKNKQLYTALAVFVAVALFTHFSSGPATVAAPAGSTPQLQSDQELIKHGERLVMIAGCHDCHTPKKMTDKGPVMDFSRALSGHPAQMPPPDVNRKEVEEKGLAVTQTLTSWVGPWGISYAANLTSDPTGIGNWTEKHFFTAIREGKHKGLESGRMLLPPMPWEMLRHMTDEELRAVYTYLKSTKPIKNVVPPAQPPVSAAPGK